VNGYRAGVACRGSRILLAGADTPAAGCRSRPGGVRPRLRVFAGVPIVQLCLMALLAWPCLADEEVRLLLTSNLQGRFSLDVEGQDLNDPYLLLGQAMLAERRAKKNVLYLDAGNAFYPGVLSKYSFGKVVMDYFDRFLCDATLVSSEDLQIGVDSLEALQQGSNTKLVSSNILRDAGAVFQPYVILPAGGVSVGVVGVSSREVLFDIAEKNLGNLALQTDPSSLDGVIREIQGQGVRHVILLSGVSLEETIGLLGRYPEIELAVCGGDNPGELYGARGMRVEMSDGRSVLLLSESDGYYLVDLVLGAGLEVKGLKRKSLEELKQAAAGRAAPLADPGYRAYTRDLALWKQKMQEEEETVVSSTGGKQYTLDARKLAFLLRDRFNAEVAFVEKESLTPGVLQDGVKASQVADLVNLDFNLFVYKLTGKELIQVAEKEKDLIANGYQGKSIQGYPVEDQRKYRVVSTQGVFERIGGILDRKVPFENQWVTVTDVILTDLRQKKVVFLDDYGYLERRFRTTVDVSLSNYFDNSSVNRSGNADVPPGQPSSDYRQWGMENEVDVKYYNSRHLFIFTPYMRYERQGDDYQSNLLRGSLFYSYNIHRIFKPYAKSMMETVVEQVQGRPILIRETVGVSALARWWSANLGLGLEDKVKDPSESPFYGLEAQGKVDLEVWKRVKYRFNLDSFFALQAFDSDRMYTRVEILNGLTFALNPYLDLGLKYRWFYYNPAQFEGEYSVNQVLTTLDVNLGAKIW
jgi:2',3'-cyclic-nucleotide 2'-phosphodiesterase (5'-nucleotidase family)